MLHHPIRSNYGDEILDNTLQQVKENTAEREAQEISTKNNERLDKLENTFHEFGLYTRKYWADRGVGHKGLSGHTGRLHVYTGGEESEYAKYIVFSFDRETGTKEQVWYGEVDFIEPRFSDDKPLFDNWDDGKKFAIRKAVKYDVVDIIDENGHVKDDCLIKRRGRK